ncbi:Peptidase family S41 [Bacteroides faecichinchillae]|uniref:Peptidase family S41 n=1 Tax=Bacteroides faecichinchillae TaxID=871325 RepID=A0A1M5A0H5_9BACE|nr:S41 family peptidase [Bacteroides faecichinchillae]THG68446.1 peptidase S41 [Bacteroides faecichinchillae]SHF23724.1 Peptidase family S41 [Bacteroides faecichinchillae]
MMNLRKIILIPALIIAFISGFISCGVDRWPEYAHQTALDSWMYDIMQQNYLWYGSMPSYDDVNLFLAPAGFLAKVKASNDSYSFVDSVMETPLPTYGFDYSLVRSQDIDTAYNALVTYVIPGSPAEKAGLQRGNWIMKVDTSYISKKYETALLQGTQARDLVMGVWKEVIPEVEEGEEEPEPVHKVVPNDITLKMGAAQIVEDNPFHKSKILDLSTGKVGYLMYNSFTAGTKDDPEKYNNELREWSAELAQENINKVILDLRYNAGGTLDCVQLLSTILAPSYYLDQKMTFLEYNDKNIDKDATLTFDQQLLKNGKNLDLNTLIVLISGETAGAPEMLMNNLNNKIQKLIGIGSSTKGQNVATEKFINEEFPWAVNPVVCTVYNSEHDTFSGGFQPHYSVSSSTDYSTFLPFGDPKEALLSVAIGVLEGTYPPTDPDEPETDTTSSKSIKIEKSVSSPASRKFIRGLQLK